jgi:hypothetical protein
MIRRLTSLFAAIALVCAVAVPPVAACDNTHAAATDTGAAMEGHSQHGANTQSDCPESMAPAGQEHDSDCLATCVSMIGCSAPSFVVETAQLSLAHQAVPTPAYSTQSHPSRSFAPDRPPPRS